MSDFENEQWKPVYGHPNYMASSHGRIKSLERYVPSGPGGVGKALKRERILRPWLLKAGYWQVAVDDVRRTVHSLVLEAFAGPRPEGMECAHMDGDRQNAKADNLKWVTHKENMSHTLEHGTHSRGEKNTQSKIKLADIPKIRSDTRSRAAIAREYGVTPEAISHIVLRKNWAWV